MKRKIWWIFILMVAFTLCQPNDVQARERRYTYGDFQYSYDDDTGYIWIEGYIGNEKEVTIPSEIQGTPVKYIYSIGYQCKNRITKVHLPEGIEYIEGFDSCVSLREINIPASVTEIGKGAFSGCRKLKSIQLPDSLNRISESAFCGCYSLTEVSIPGNVKKIGSSAFAECRNLKKVKLSQGLKEIGDDAFCNCYSLREISIPDSVTTLGESAFRQCKNLKKVKVSNNVTCIQSLTFDECESLKIVQLPKNLEWIKSCAFYGAGFTKVTIPKNVNRIGYRAFASCKNLKKITFKATRVGYIDKQAFEGIKKNTVFDVPDKSISKYKKVLGKIKGFKKGKIVVK